MPRTIIPWLRNYLYNTIHHPVSHKYTEPPLQNFKALPYLQSQPHPPGETTRSLVIVQFPKRCSRNLFSLPFSLYTCFFRTWCVKHKGQWPIWNLSFTQGSGCNSPGILTRPRGRGRGGGGVSAQGGGVRNPRETEAAPFPRRAVPSKDGFPPDSLVRTGSEESPPGWHRQNIRSRTVVQSPEPGGARRGRGRGRGRSWAPEPVTPAAPPCGQWAPSGQREEAVA